MLSNASLEQLIKIANELDSRGLMKESDEVDALIKEALAFTTAAIIALIAAGFISAVASKVSESANDIFTDMGITDLPTTPAKDLYEGFRNTLTETDLIDGPGSFPQGHPEGGTFVRKVFDSRMEKMLEGDFDVKIDEDEFQEEVRKYWNVSSFRWHATNLDNENGWVDAWNAITDILEEQYHAVKEVEKKKEDGMSEEDAIASVAGGGSAAGAGAAAATTGAPPPVPGGGAFHYHGPSGQAQLSAEEIAGKVSENKNARHLVWAAGWPAWKRWTEVPEVSALVSSKVTEAPPVTARPAPDFSAPAAAEPAKPEYGSLEEAFGGRGDDDSDADLISHDLKYDKDKDEWVAA